MVEKIAWLLFCFILLPSAYSERRRPIISSIEPQLGGVQGGTKVVINGANLKSDSLFGTSRVFFGDFESRCDVIEHYSSDSRIVCESPPCLASSCKDEHGYHSVDVGVHVSTTEGILTASSTFSYLSNYTPHVYSMQSTVYGNALGRIESQTRLHFLDELSLVIGDGNYANLGTNGDLNDEVFEVDDSVKTFYYSLPEDVVAGFYNLSLYVQDSSEDDLMTTSGKAAMFRGEHESNDDEHRPQFKFQSSLGGTNYSLCVLPAIFDVSPKYGSIGGGTLLHIAGSGFSSNKEELEVYAGGLPCHIIASNPTSIACETSPFPLDQSFNMDIVKNNLPRSALKNSRDAGSSGWWCKLYGDEPEDMNDVEQSKIQFGFRQNFYFSLWDMFGSNWSSVVGVDSIEQSFVVDAAAVFSAPYSGRYTFYVSSHDMSFLFGSYEGIGVNESLLCSSDDTESLNLFEDTSQVSSPIELTENQSFFLRNRLVNVNGRDSFLLAVKISPIYDCEGNLTSSFEEECTGFHSSAADMFFNPMPSWMVSVPLSWATSYDLYSNVEVFKKVSPRDKLKAVCGDGLESFGPNFKRESNRSSEHDCAFEYSSHVTAVATSANATYVNQNTAEVIVRGTGFNRTDHVNSISVTVGGVGCNITSLSATSLSCVVSDAPGGDAIVIVNVKGHGNAYTIGTLTVTIAESVVSVYPLSGSVAGGQKIAIEGYGLQEGATIEMGSGRCEVTYYSPSRIECITPPAATISIQNSSYVTSPHSNSSNVTAHEEISTITVGSIVFPDNFCYNASSTPVVDSVYPNDISSATTQLLEIIGDGFALGSQVSIGNSNCIIQELFSDLITCLLIRSGYHPAIDVDVVVSVPGSGYAADRNALTSMPSIFVGYEVTSVVPRIGSRMGGSFLTIEGYGFESGQIEKHKVTLYPISQEVSETEVLMMNLGFENVASATVDCSVVEVNFDTIKCVIPEQRIQLHEDNYTVVVTLNGLSTECHTSNCMFLFTNTSTPKIGLLETQFFNVSTGQSVVRAIGNSVLGSALQTNEQLTVQIGKESCEVLSTDYKENRIDILIPAISAGSYALSVLVNSYGYSYISADVQQIVIATGITSISLDKSGGSVGGGVLGSIAGYGFSLNCSSNRLILTGQGFNISSSDAFSCSHTQLNFKVSSALGVLNGDWKNVSTSSWSVNVAGAVSSPVPTIFKYDTTLTPFLKSITSSASFGESVQVAIKVPFIDAFSGVSITVGAQECSLESQSLNGSMLTVNFLMPDLPGGQEYDVLVNVSPFGVAVDFEALSFPKILSKFSVNEMIPYNVTSSIDGGDYLTITGVGLSKDTVVSVCGSTCKHLPDMSSSTSLSCLIPSKRTVASYQYFESINLQSGDIVSVEGTFFGSTSSPLSLLEDSDISTSVLCGDTFNCHFGVEIRNGYQSSPYKVLFYPSLESFHHLSKVTFEGSIDGSTYEEISSITKFLEGWNGIESPAEYQEQWFSHLRVQVECREAGQCNIAELRFTGIMAAVVDECKIEVSAHDMVNSIGGAGKSTSTVGSLKYDAEISTPIVFSLSPSHGTALGGSSVTILGKNFLSPTDASRAPLVHLSGVPCNVSFFSDTEIHCMSGVMVGSDDSTPTGDRRSLSSVGGETSPSTSETSLFVVGSGDGVWNQSATFTYVHKWSALTTWQNHEPPINGDIVRIPKGKTIMLDVDTPLLQVLLVEGCLYFDHSKDINLDAHYVIVNGGQLEVGNNEHPFLNRAVITLHGSRDHSVKLPRIGSKVLAVGGKGLGYGYDNFSSSDIDLETGTLKLFGKPRLRVWTKLNETALAGQDFVVTSEPVDFEHGDKLVITGSEIGSQPNEVTVVRMDGPYRVYFHPPLSKLHRSEQLEIDGRKVDLRCEVALLSRNVVVRGSDGSDEDLYGVHTIATGSNAMYQIQNVEITSCGQAFKLGRYCTHFYQGGHAEGSFVKSSSIHHSFQRAIVAHQTSQLQIRDNVAYDIKGHSYAVETGNEYHNVFSGNLGVWIKASSSSLKSDLQPAVFWTSNPNNYWYDNVGVHSESFGYWFASSSSTSNAPSNGECVKGEHLGSFLNNTFKVNKEVGYRIYPSWTPHEDPCDASSPTSPQHIRWLTCYRNSGGGLFIKNHGSLHHLDSAFLENEGIDASIEKYVEQPYTLEAAFSDTLFIGSLESDADHDMERFAIWAPQHEFFYIRNATFVNYGLTALLSGCNNCDDDESSGAFTTRLSGLKFVESFVRIRWSPPYKQIFWDLDGSLTGHKNAYLLKWYPYNSWSPLCSKTNVELFDDSMLCVNTSVRRLEVSQVQPSSLENTLLGVRADKTNLSTEFQYSQDGWVAPVVSNQFYWLEWAGSEQPAEFNLTFGNAEYITRQFEMSHRNESVGIRFSPLSSYDPYTFNIFYDGSWYSSETSSRSTLLEPMASSSYVNSTLDVTLSTISAALEIKEPFSVKVKAQLCSPPGCPTPTVVPTVTPTLCMLGDRHSCSDRGVCELDSDGKPHCVCDDVLHYWPSELCAEYHPGGELEPDHCCIPDKRDYYCSWLGVCDPTGSHCLCDDTDHRYAEDRCATWHASVPTSHDLGSESFKVFILESTNELGPLILTVDLSMTVWLLKQDIFRALSTPTYRQDLVFENKSLDNARGLEFYGLKNSSSIVLNIDNTCPLPPGEATQIPTLSTTAMPSVTNPMPSPSLSPSASSHFSSPSLSPSWPNTNAPTVPNTTHAPTLSPSSSTSCTLGDRAYCHYRGVCVSDGSGTSCECYDYLHYWSSDQCSQRHDGRELEPGQVCYPNTVDQYCNWLGKCSPGGDYCICFEPEHRIPDDNCKKWHYSLPTPAPVISPTIADSPSMAPHLSPTLSPVEPDVRNCDPGDRAYCHNKGICDSSGEKCVCDDVYHYWSSERCSKYHWGRELAPGQSCFPYTVDYYCNYLGVCDSNGTACECFDSVHRSPADRCKTYTTVTATAGPTPAPSPLPPGQVCVSGDTEYCHHNGFCLDSGEGCGCWDESHYWPSERCEHYHHGPELDTGECCLPGYVDYYCSWLGECSSDGSSCICHDPEHYWASERCQQYHPGPDPANTSATSSCPALLSIPAEDGGSTGSGNGNSLGDAYYFVISFAALLLLLLVGFVGYRAYRQRQDKRSSSYAYSQGDYESTYSNPSLSGVNHTFQHLDKAADCEISTFELEGADEEVDLSNIAGVYKGSLGRCTTPESSREVSSSSYQSFMPSRKRTVVKAQKKDFEEVVLGTEDVVLDVVTNPRTEQEFDLANTTEEFQI